MQTVAKIQGRGLVVPSCKAESDLSYSAMVTAEVIPVVVPIVSVKQGHLSQPNEEGNSNEG